MTADVVLSPKLIERRRSVRRERRRRKRRIALAVLLLVGGTSSAFAMTRSRFFAVEEIKVEGERLVTAAEVVDASGIAVGENALSIDLAEAERGVSAITEIADVSIAREGLAVVITVRERTPALVVKGSGAPYVVDREAVPLDVPVEDAAGLPVVSVAVTPDRLGSPALLTPEVARGLARVYAAIPSRLRRTIDAFELGTEGLAFDAGGTRVVFGAVSSIGAKLEGWRLVRDRVAADDDEILVIDLRAPGRPAAKIS